MYKQDYKLTISSDINGEDVYYVPSGRWLCELEDNSWLVLTDEEYGRVNK